MHIELFDTSGFVWSGLEFPPAERFPPASTIPADDLDKWFSEWARDRKGKGAFQKEGLFLIHANGRFTRRAHQQDLQGVELLKHIRLTRWLGPARAWHAIVYSFEPLTSILSRKPGDLIVTSPGVTFLRLPDALSLRDALVRAYPKEAWESVSAQEILASLPKASPQDRGFRRYIACDYSPPDSAHSISNWWGIYEMFLAVCRIEFPEYADSSPIPKDVRDFVLRLETKKADFLEGSRNSSPFERERLQETLGAVRSTLIKASLRKTIVYVDDEASNGWTAVLRSILGSRGADACTLHTIDRSSLALPNPDDAGNRPAYEARIKEIASIVTQQKPQLLILDLRLRGDSEANQPPDRASGMDLARAVRNSNRYLPILLFTASNKAETLVVSGSLDIDNFWMKPGLGEHRGLRSREEDLLDLVEKLTMLLGDDYGWLQRISKAVEDIRTAQGSHWWEREIKWPVPSNRRGSDVQKANSNCHKEVLQYLDSMLYTASMILRLRTKSVAQLQSEGKVVPIVPDSLEGRLCAGLFNQVGQVVELLHDAANKRTDPVWGEFSRSGNSRIGGYRDDSNNGYVFRRRDWWGFNLFAWRNKFSHPGSATNLKEVKSAASDLVAWLTLGPPSMKRVSSSAHQTIAEVMLQRGPFQDRACYPVMRLDVQEPGGQLDIEGVTIFSEEPSGPCAQDMRFREQLTLRREFNQLEAKSRKIMHGI